MFCRELVIYNLGSKHMEKEGLVRAITLNLTDLLVKYHYIQITKRLNVNEPRLHLTELHYTDNCWQKTINIERNNMCSANCIELACQ